MYFIQQSFVINEIREKKINRRITARLQTVVEQKTSATLYLLYLDTRWVIVCK